MKLLRGISILFALLGSTAASDVPKRLDWRTGAVLEVRGDGDSVVVVIDGGRDAYTATFKGRPSDFEPRSGILIDFAPRGRTLYVHGSDGRVRRSTGSFTMSRIMYEPGVRGDDAAPAPNVKFPASPMPNLSPPLPPLVVSIAARERTATNAEAPQSFYVTVHSVSDASPFWFDYVLDVTTSGESAHVTLIRIAPLDQYCPSRITVKSKEVTIPASTVNEIAKDLCSVTGKQVDAAVANAKPKRQNSIFDSASYGIVTRCDGKEDVLKLPMPEQVDGAKLKQTTPKIEALWQLPWQLFQAAFNGNPLASNDGEFDVESQRAAEPFIEKVRAGAYDKAFGDRGFWGGQAKLSSVMSGYRGIAVTHPPSAELLEKATFNFTHYVAPIYPQIAKAARVQGDVKLTFEVDPQTGATRNVAVTSGHPMLVQAVYDATRLWRFETPIQNDAPQHATLRFVLTAGAACDATEQP
jgi:TonB family protein